MEDGWETTNQYYDADLCITSSLFTKREGNTKAGVRKTKQCPRVSENMPTIWIRQELIQDEVFEAVA